jgi:hypothetical protein
MELKKGANMKRAILILTVIVGLIFIFNGCEKKVYVLEPDTTPPSIPKGVYSITGDESIFIDWEPNDEPDFMRYNIYWSLNPDNGFTYFDYTSVSQYTDLDVKNGTTYYYIITAEDYSRNESEPSKIIYDTPRPEGHLRLHNNAVLPNQSGLYFDNKNGPIIVTWNNPLCDLYLDEVSEVFYLNTTVKNDIPNDLQDMGFTFTWEEINVAPDTIVGWSELSYVPVSLGHTYVIWTWDNHYAKLRATYVDTLYYEFADFEWAYQTDIGNPELKPVPKRIANK